MQVSEFHSAEQRLSATLLSSWQIKAVYYNGTAVANANVYLFMGDIWLPRRLENLTTDSYGLATFSFSTAALTGILPLQV